MTKRAVLLLSVMLLSGCGTGFSRMGSESAADGAQEAERLQSRIAWLLLEADEALLRQQLTTPEGDNAFARYQDVLRLQPENLEAQRGLERIVNSYLRWADSAMARGNVEKAQTYIDRARLVLPNSRRVKSAQAKLVNAGKVPAVDGEYAIDGNELKKRSASLSSYLAEVGRKVEQEQAVFLIVAPNDRDARWIFQQMQKGSSQRLRGNIQTGSASRVRILQKPGSGDNS
ncbi:tetratricopeptide repeat protein [Aestuariirhabdus sp. Z084]|uniref:tetratricopeptide repeat protein n=1 Tax=Aestuariirhabdus haliotis TaxID=2918751 RepID=UPI00201B3918|nr:tetratricopeptide repeat protein [Aestuariirhabdus haliotis]MCL6414926.1 tetratricopeptide repeat protein [Aestuariirhabdus haliotis]MCL6418858.1 tetratricopeptide repeat protein [Aestuariirhabdus haliotis]